MFRSTMVSSIFLPVATVIFVSTLEEERDVVKVEDIRRHLLVVRVVLWVVRGGDDPRGDRRSCRHRPPGSREAW